MAVTVTVYVPAGRLFATVRSPVFELGFVTVNAEGKAELTPVNVLSPVPWVAVNVS